MSDNSDPDRPVVYADTGIYEVKVWGKESDELDDTLDAFDHACDRAMEDIDTAEREWKDNGGYGTQ